MKKIFNSSYDHDGIGLYFGGSYFHSNICLYNLDFPQVLCSLGLPLEPPEALEAGTDGHVAQAAEAPYAAHANGKVIGGQVD